MAIASIALGDYLATASIALGDYLATASIALGDHVATASIALGDVLVLVGGAVRRSGGENSFELASNRRGICPLRQRHTQFTTHCQGANGNRVNRAANAEILG